MLWLILVLVRAQKNLLITTKELPRQSNNCMSAILLLNGSNSLLVSWATHVGYELVDPQLNRNYSMWYMFTNGPFTHTGLKADITKGKHGFMVGISNATDYRIPPDGLYQ